MATIAPHNTKKTSNTGALTGFTFSTQTPKEFSAIVLKQARITNLNMLNKVFAGDPGTPVEMVRRKDGFGFEFVDKTLTMGYNIKHGWFILERPPASTAEEPPRMRIFNTFEGAAAEFAIKIRLHEQGSLMVGKVALSTTVDSMCFTFGTPTRTMVMAPVLMPLVGVVL